MSTGTILLSAQSGKISGGFIANPARIDGGSGAWKLLFAADKTECALWQFRMPKNYSSGLTAKLQYTMASAASGNVNPEIDIMAVSDGDAQDVDVASFDIENEISGGTTVPGTAGYLDEISIALVNNNNIAAGDLVIIRLARDHDDAGDTASGDMEVRAFSLEYTTT